ncbi:methionyl-tRNA formyltransferase [Paenibacillus beijingensis]|uniref:Methionyl-tRNA formyltransferase n=1 Tax=Paenibacillus beijingensis TaxID=1126833 RepID=A0A0D5NNF7_9BACL|nr:methionyl-tRNA formyltransferase [Paenibacillus beijingensis]AJY76458.1 methionyl-tRNA formyltransferase [Paenibacillus beijingensis]
MRIVFMGTPQFAVPSLTLLLERGYEVVAVITQPDRPKGRKKTLTPPPVKEAALLHGLPVLQPERLRSPEAVEAVKSFKPDLIVTAAYGQILPKAVLELPRLGCINVHGSLLPKYRGGAPIQRSIMNGETVTGVTIMYMAEGLDTGDMISCVEVPITDEDTSGTMFEKLSIAGAELLGRTLPAIEAGEAAAVPQRNEEATYAPNLTREDERIDWSRSARELFNQVRGLSPAAGAFTQLAGDVFKVRACRTLAPGQAPASAAAPGTVLRTGADGIAVQTGGGVLLLTEIQPAGKRAMNAGDWLKGASLPEGTVLGETGEADSAGRLEAEGGPR